MFNYKAILTAGLFIASSAANAGTVTAVSVSGVGCATGTPICFANTDKDIGDGTCTNMRQVRWDGSTSEGKSITATMLTAAASDGTVTIGFFDAQCFGGATAFPDLNFVAID